MKLTEKGKDFIKHWEGCRLTAYKCSAGTWTIGYGWTRDVHDGDVISQKEAEDLFLKAIAPVEAAVTANVKVPLSEDEFTALCSFTYNLGIGAFAASTLLRYLNEGKREEASLEFLRWDKIKVNGQYVSSLGLARRREAERALFVGETRKVA